ncbi:MAG: hypothetical protein ACKVQA_20650 [Burkholderiales bacterium]
MENWTKHTLDLSPTHSWKAKPGHNIVVIDRGAVRFQVPQNWIVKPDDDSIKILDREPPDDDCRIAASHQTAFMEFATVPLATMVELATRNDERPVHTWLDVHEFSRLGLQAAWREMRFVDEAEKREAIAKLCIGRRGGVHGLITMEFWESDSELFRPVWDTVLETLEIGEPVADPLIGPPVH